MNETIRFFTPAKGFAAALRLMARQAFSDAFAHLYDPVPFKEFLDKAVLQNSTFGHRPDAIYSAAG
jgi:hypothetical protein